MSDKAVESGRDHWQWVMVSYNTKCQKNNLQIILGRVNEETMVQSENKLRVQWSKNCVWRQCNANTKLAAPHPFETEGSLQSNCKIWLHLLNKECYQQDKRKAEKAALVCTVGSHLSTNGQNKEYGFVQSHLNTLGLFCMRAISFFISLCTMLKIMIWLFSL